MIDIYLNGEDIKECILQNGVINICQHAHNPVDRYPWGNEAFEKAMIEDKPIFLSIGYSTCHWCHVTD